MIRLCKTIGICSAALMLTLGVSNVKSVDVKDKKVAIMAEKKYSTELLTKLKEAFSQANEKTLTDVLQTQFEIHEDMQLGDAYKLLHQGTFGPEHSVYEGSRGSLYKEFEDAKPDKEERMVELISPKFSIYRINIRPYKAHGGDKEALFEWFYESSRIKKGSIQDFIDSWIELRKFIEQNKEKNYLPIEEVESIEKELKEYPVKDLPAIHHTDQYMQANSPSYVVVSYEAMPDHFKKYLEKF